MEKKKKIGIWVCLIIIILIVIGISYAFLRNRIYGEKGKIIYHTGSLDVVLEEDSTTSLELTGAVPISDEEGVKSDKVYRFTVINRSGSNLKYEIYLDNDTDALKECGDSCNLMDDEDIKYELKKEKSIINTIENRKLTESMILKGGRNTYELRLWINSEAGNEIVGKYFFGKIRVEVVQDYSNPKKPLLASNMIPVRYDGTNWVKADDKNWYDYKKGEWANAVTVSSDVRDEYIGADDGITIPMDKIDTMWVWIPRYSYTIGSEDGENYYGKKGEFLTTTPTQTLPGEIDIEFVDKNTKDRGSAKYKVSEGVSGWYTPDAFTFGDKELEGIWVGKFETSNKENSSSDNESLTPIIKPKITSWRGIRVSTLENVAFKMNQENNIYGFVSSEVDTHAMKGSEWSVVTYLSQSKYGKLGNRSYTGKNKEVYVNAYIGYRTGCSYGEPSFPNGLGEQECSHDYDEIEDRGEGLGAAGAGASTTGNIYGIYDMSGGSWEYVMSNFNGYTGNTESLNSGYNGLLTNGSSYDKGIPYPDEKYYDKYLSENTNLISHALGETAGWYKDYTLMINSTYPWQFRGGDWSASSGAGVFIFGAAGAAGSDSSVNSFRLVLVSP